MSVADRSTRVALVVAWTLAASLARAEDAAPGAKDEAAAEALFVEGKRLVARGDLGAGCAKLAESERLDPAPGTLLNLADCYEKNGQLASAWVSFRDAAAAADRGERPVWKTQAEGRAALLAPRVSTLAVRVAEADRAPGLVVTRDGAPIGDQVLGSAIPIDGGEYVIEARAPGRVAWSQRVHVDPEAARVVIDVPALPLAPPKVALLDAPVPASRAPRTIALALAAGGVAAVGVGTYFGLRAIRRNDDALAVCPTSPRCPDAVGPAYTDQARADATTSTVAFVIGGAMLAGAGVVFFASRGSPSSPVIAIAPNGASIGGRF